MGYGVPVLGENDLVVLHDVPAEDKVPCRGLGGQGVRWGGPLVVRAGDDVAGEEHVRVLAGHSPSPVHPPPCSAAAGCRAARPRWALNPNH